MVWHQQKQERVPDLFFVSEGDGFEVRAAMSG
jgi:hypothetical protein